MLPRAVLCLPPVVAMPATPDTEPRPQGADQLRLLEIPQPKILGIRAMPVARAELKVGEIREEKAVSADDKVVAFRLRLKSGRTGMQTWFRDAAGKEIAGAYYVSVRAR